MKKIINYIAKLFFNIYIDLPKDRSDISGIAQS